MIGNRKGWINIDSQCLVLIVKVCVEAFHLRKKRYRTVRFAIEGLCKVVKKIEKYDVPLEEEFMKTLQSFMMKRYRAEPKSVVDSGEKGGMMRLWIYCVLCENKSNTVSKFLETMLDPTILDFLANPSFSYTESFFTRLTNRLTAISTPLSDPAEQKIANQKLALFSTQTWKSQLSLPSIQLPQILHNLLKNSLFYSSINTRDNEDHLRMVNYIHTFSQESGDIKNKAKDIINKMINYMKKDPGLDKIILYKFYSYLNDDWKGMCTEDIDINIHELFVRGSPYSYLCTTGKKNEIALIEENIRILKCDRINGLEIEEFEDNLFERLESEGWGRINYPLNPHHLYALEDVPLPYFYSSTLQNRDFILKIAFDGKTKPNLIHTMIPNLDNGEIPIIVPFKHRFGKEKYLKIINQKSNGLCPYDLLSMPGRKRVITRLSSPPSGSVWPALPVDIGYPGKLLTLGGWRLYCPDYGRHLLVLYPPDCTLSPRTQGYGLVDMRTEGSLHYLLSLSSLTAILARGNGQGWIHYALVSLHR